MKNLTQYLNESLSINKIFVIIKPGFLNKSKEIIEYFKKFGWLVEKTTTKKLLLQESRKLYEVHKKESFYNDLCEYMSSEPCRAFIFRKETYLKSDMFKETNNIKNKLRDMYGESDMRNVIHSSDSVESMDKEMRIFF